MKIKNTEVEIIKCDITELEIDAIVSPANTSLSMDSGLAKIITQKGGKVIEEEALEEAPLAAGEAILTNAGQLKANYIIHAIINEKAEKTDQEKLRNAIANAFNIAKDFNIFSIAIPAVGCGSAGFPKQASAKILAQEILKVIKHQKTSLGKIIICIIDDETFKIFDETIKGYITHIQDTLGDGPYITVDAIIEMPQGIILIERSNPPYGWALPGGFVDYGETLESAVAREAKEETNMELTELRQFHTYSDPKRDPRFHTVTTVFTAKGKGVPKAGDDAKGLKIIPYEHLSDIEYAFDHKSVIKDYLEKKF